MIRGMHAMFYSAQAEALRAFLRDQLRLPFTDVGRGWLVFDVPEGDLGVHPTDHPGSPPSGTHDVSFYCDDLERTITELRGRGVEIIDAVTDQGYGLVTHFVMPGGVRAELYQPRYQKRGDAQRPLVQQFLEAYGKALVAGDLAVIVASYALPCLVVGEEGAVAVTDARQIEAFFGGATAQYAEKGIVGTRPEILRLEPLSARLLSVDVHWPYVLKDGGERPGETSRYLLHLDESGTPRLRSAVVLGPR